jgi:CubicO group peptidase (beta-lactamase class C family)
MQRADCTEHLAGVLDRYTESRLPGLQYIVIEADGELFEYAGGWADIGKKSAMTHDTTMMACSMTKTFTAVAILQLVEQGRVGLHSEIDRYLPGIPYAGRQITIRQLLTHTSGIPNPLPLRWAHLVEDDASFDESAALARVLLENQKLAFEPGRKYAYSNIGYWLLGKIVEQLAGESYPDYVRKHILSPLSVSKGELDFVIPDKTRHANGYLPKYSLMNLLRGYLTDRKFRGEYEDRWLQIKSHYLNGPAFGGLIGTARSFSRFLQDQLHQESVLFSRQTKRLMETQQRNTSGDLIPMTYGWHAGAADGTLYLFKEGGGAGFHSEMRLYLQNGVASVVMANSSSFNSTGFLNRYDRKFL